MPLLVLSIGFSFSLAHLLSLLPTNLHRPTRFPLLPIVFLFPPPPITPSLPSSAHHPLSSLLPPSTPLYPPPPINPSLPSSPHQPLSTLLPPSPPLFPPPPTALSLPLPPPAFPSTCCPSSHLATASLFIRYLPLPRLYLVLRRLKTSLSLHSFRYLAFAPLLNCSLLLPLVPPTSPGGAPPWAQAREPRRQALLALPLLNPPPPPLSPASPGVLSGAPLEWMDLGVALDVAGLQQCVGQGRVVTVDAYLRGEGRFIRDAPWVKLLPHGDDDGGVDTDDFTTGGSNSGDNSSTTSTGTSTGGGINNEDTNNGGGAASEANINDPAHLARVCTAAPIPASNVTLRQFLSFFGARTEQVIGLGDVFEVTGSVDVGQVGETGEDLGGVGGSLTDSLVEGHYDGVNGARDARARLLADKLLEGHASSDGLPGLYDGLNGAVPILPPCRLAMRPHPAALSAAHAFTRRVLGTRFAALHLRRTDFATHCLRPGFRCWLPLSQIARCVADRINALNAAAGVAGATAASGGGSAAAVAVAAGVKEGAASSGMEQHQTVRTLFVATDTTDQELRCSNTSHLSILPVPSSIPPQELCWFTQMLKSLVWGEITVIQYPHSKSAAPGAAELQVAGIIAHSSTRGTVEKMVCVHALVFWGTPRSTWSKDVLRMRGALGVEHCGDDWVCGGEETEDLRVRELNKWMNA
ncbi:unnamed protein product [Closterium sp. NIES-65]|nr:unnamed protein product [Closterium sp. NIES-65]